jgi:hypothetical protein
MTPGNHRFRLARVLRAGARQGDTGPWLAENDTILQMLRLSTFVHTPEDERPAALVVGMVTGEGLERVARTAVKAGIVQVERIVESGLRLETSPRVS